ncbi:MAG: toll/interleukin-1 receptor domain-containing protein [Desulfobaccales bacterium]
MRKSLFISYSRSDMAETDWIARLKMYLAPLQRMGIVDTWDDSRIESGADWRTEINKALDKATAAVLLVGPGFLASEFVMQYELPILLEAASQRGCKVFPVVVGYCGYTATELERYQAVNDPNRPLESLPRAEQNKILNEISMLVDRALRASPNTFLPGIEPNEKPEKDTLKENGQHLESKGVFDFIKESNESAQEINNIILEISSNSTVFSQNVLERANLILGLSTRRRPQASNIIQENLKMIAVDINQVADKIELDIDRLDKNIDILTQSYSGYLDWLKNISDKQILIISPFRQTLQNSLNETKILLASLAYYRDSVSKLIGLSKYINRACTRLNQALDDIKSKIEIIVAFYIKLLILIDEAYSK